MSVVALVVLHVTRESGRRIVATITNGTLERLHVVVRLHMNLEMVRAAKGRLAVGTPIPLVACNRHMNDEKDEERTKD